ncbi:hypothetical protein GCM10023148_55690 [Actinokineospora soli]
MRGGSAERARVLIELSEEDTARLAAAARAAGVTQNTLVQTAWGLVLSALTGRADVVFGQTVSGRPADLPGAESVIGLLINTVPVRITPHPGETAGTLLARVADEQSRLIEHHHLGLADIQRTAGVGQLFDSLVVFENFPVDERTRVEPAPGLRVVAADGVDATHYPLTLAVLPGRRVTLQLEHHPDCYTAEQARVVLDRLVRVLDQLTDPAVRVADVDALSDDERDLVLRAWNDRALPVRATTLVGLLADAVARDPHGVAVVDSRRTLTFAQLDAAANRLAHLLVERGVGPEKLVALLLPRTADFIVALYAVLKAGGAYLPIDPEYPPARVAAMLADATPLVTITTLAGAAAPGGALFVEDDPGAGRPDTSA